MLHALCIYHAPILLTLLLALLVRIAFTIGLLCVQLPNGVAKARSRALTALVDGFGDCYQRLVGSLQRVCVVELAADGRHLVGHTKSYIQASTFSCWATTYPSC